MRRSEAEAAARKFEMALELAQADVGFLEGEEEKEEGDAVDEDERRNALVSLHVELADCRSALGDYEEAAEAYETALEMHFVYRQIMGGGGAAGRAAAVSENNSGNVESGNDSSDGDGHTPLFLAAVMGRTGTVGYLLSRGADPNAGSYTTLTGPSSYSSRPTRFFFALPPHPRAFLLLAAAHIYLPHCRRGRGPSSFSSRLPSFMLGIATAAKVRPPSP